MLTTSYNQGFNFNVVDSTVLVNPGTARVGNTIIPYRGGSIQLTAMSHWGDHSNVYQYSALLLQNFPQSGGAPWGDLTSVVSAIADTTQSLQYPSLGPDATFAPQYPIGLFTLFTTDGTNSTVINSTRING